MRDNHKKTVLSVEIAKNGTTFEEVADALGLQKEEFMAIIFDDDKTFSKAQESIIANVLNLDDKKREYIFTE